MMGEGGSIPFMGMLGEKFPAAQFVITGVLGPHSNAHGPNEFLHIAMGKAREPGRGAGAGRSLGAGRGLSDPIPAAGSSPGSARASVEP